VNAILSSFEADVAQLRDMALNRLIYYPPQISKLCYIPCQRSA